MPVKKRKPLTRSNAIFYSFEYEKREAARHCGYTWEQFCALPGDECWIDPQQPTNSQAMCIAQYRAFGKIEADKWTPEK